MLQPGFRVLGQLLTIFGELVFVKRWVNENHPNPLKAVSETHLFGSNEFADLSTYAGDGVALGFLKPFSRCHA